jgi:hypothetical protein
MKTTQCYDFMFVAIPRQWLRAPSTVGSAGILPVVFGMLPDNAHRGTPRAAGRNLRIMCAAQKTADNMPATASNLPALPDHLFWTWFVDNPRPVRKSS